MTPRPRDEDPASEEAESTSRIRLTPISLLIVLLLFWIAINVTSLLVTALMAILLGTLLEGPVSRIQERRVPRAAAIAMVYIFMIAAVVALVLIIVPVVQDQAATFREDFPQTVNELRADWRQSSNALLSGPGVGVLDQISGFFDEPATALEATGETAEQALPILTTVGTTLGGGIVSVITALVVTFYYLLEKKLIRRIVIEQIPARNQQRVDQLWTSVEQKTGGWLRGQLMLCLIIGVIATTAYGIIGLSFWPLLGLWAGITEIIPIVGPWIGGIPAVIVALTQGWETALIVGLVIVGMQSVENWVLVPRVMRGAVGLTPMTVFVAILAGTELMGVVGAVLAIPIAAGVQVVLTDLIQERRSRMVTEQPHVSGWRWMLARGKGRGSSGDSPPDDNGGEQAGNPERGSGEDEASGMDSWGPSADDDPDDPDRIDSRAEATWPANPWKGKVPATRRAQTWSGASRSGTRRSSGTAGDAPRGNEDAPNPSSRARNTSEE